MRKIIFLLGAILFLGLPIRAQIVDKYAQLVSEQSVDFLPTYFFKPDPSGQHIGYTQKTDKLFIFDMNSKNSKRVDGKFDPVFFPLPQSDKKIVVTSLGNYGNDSGLAFIEWQDKVSTKTDFKKIFKDGEVKGVYQSVGILKKISQDEFYFRVMVQVAAGVNGNNFLYRDYKYKQNTIKPLSIENKATKYVPICKNLSLSLAMISKDGREVVGYNMKTQNTQVLELNSDHTCSIVDDWNFIAGKAAFSYDKRFITYHKLSNYVYNRDGFINTPKNDMIGNIYLFDRQTKTHYPLTQYENGTAMYPEFLENDEIIFIYYSHKSGSDIDVKFVRIKPNTPVSQLP